MQAKRAVAEAEGEECRMEQEAASLAERALHFRRSPPPPTPPPDFCPASILTRQSWALLTASAMGRWVTHVGCMMRRQSGLHLELACMVAVPLAVLSMASQTNYMHRHAQDLLWHLKRLTCTDMHATVIYMISAAVRSPRISRWSSLCSGRPYAVVVWAERLVTAGD